MIGQNSTNQKIPFPAKMSNDILTFEAPLLPLKDIADVFQAFGLPVEDIKQPTPDYVRRVYAKFLEKLFDTTLDELCRSKFVNTEVFDYPELHDISIQEFEFRRNLKFLFTSIGIGDFSVIADLTQPESKRFRQLASGLINFARFRQKRVDKYEEMSQESEKFTLRRDRLGQDVIDLQASLSKVNQKKNAEKSEISNLEVVNEEMAKELSKLNIKQLEIQNYNKEQKQKITELTSKNDMEKSMLETLKRENEMLKQQIVPNPELFKKKLLMLADQCEELKNQIKKVESRIVGNNKKIEANIIQKRELNKLVEFASECEKENNKLLKCAEENKILAHSIEKLKEEKEELIIFENHLTRQLISQQEKFERLRKQHEEKTNSKREVYQDAIREKQILGRKKDEYMGKVDSSKQNIVELRMVLEKLTNTHEVAISELVGKFDQLENGIYQYHSQLERTMRI
jgi:kinetochore protein Nuf2